MHADVYLHVYIYVKTSYQRQLTLNSHTSSRGPGHPVSHQVRPSRPISPPSPPPLPRTRKSECNARGRMSDAGPSRALLSRILPTRGRRLQMRGSARPRGRDNTRLGGPRCRSTQIFAGGRAGERGFTSCGES